MGRRARAALALIFLMFAVLGYVGLAQASPGGDKGGPDDPNCEDLADNDGDTFIDDNDPDCRKPGCIKSDQTPNKCFETNIDDECADSDDDGVCDGDDECPFEPGSPPDGCPSCPDADGDGVCDDVDECPDEAGDPPSGCPPCPAPDADTDGDGVCDSVDECPDVAGDPPTGCPPDCTDTDGDGVCDDVDECPDVAGDPPTGCPPDCTDTDGDGVCDDVDQCPDVAGDPPTGCPPATEACIAEEDAGLLTEHTLGQEIWNGGGDALSPLLEDPEHNGVISGPLNDALNDTPIEVVGDEATCLLDLLLDETVSPVDL